MDNPKGYVNPDLLITASELEALIPQIRDTANPQHPVLIDLRRPDQFANGHIPGAAHLDLYGISLIDTDPAPLRAFMWIIEHLLGTRGVTLDRTVIVYDDATGDRVSRAFWFLEYFGHQHVRVLDGGYAAWLRDRREIATQADAPVDTAWAGERHPDLLATREDVLARIESRDAVIVDARSTEEYCGTMVRAARAGAIPHAIHIEWMHNLDANGELRPAAELRTLYETAGVTPDREVVSYCQGGYRAAHTYLALRLLGYPRLRNYVGSWREWGNRTDTPIEIPVAHTPAVKQASQS
jgi:thiosulfate/3-mercaptopyruvate sulfurtransferase